MKRGVQTCSICTHNDRAAIEAGLVSATPYRMLAKTFGVSPAALSRHRNHGSEDAGDARDALQVRQHEDGLLQGIDKFIAELRQLGIRAKRQKSPATSIKLALAVSRELRAWLSLRAQLARQPPAMPLAKGDPELSDDQLESMAAALLLSRGKEKTN